MTIFCKHYKEVIKKKKLPLKFVTGCKYLFIFINKKTNFSECYVPNLIIIKDEQSNHFK